MNESKSVVGIQAVAELLAGKEGKVGNGDLPQSVRTSSTEISKPAFEITTVACFSSASSPYYLESDEDVHALSRYLLII